MIDHLTGFLPGVKTIDRETYSRNVEAVCVLGKAFQVPTFVLGDEGDYRGIFMAPIKEHLAAAPRFPRTTPSAWRASGLVAAISATGRRKLVMGGISLDNCLLQTAIDALTDDFEVFVLVDISGTESQLVETAAMARLSGAGAVLTSWVSWAAELMEDFAGPHGDSVGDAFARFSTWGQPSAT